MNTDPPGDFDQSIVDVFKEMLTEAQMTPAVLTFPPAVIASIKAYEIRARPQTGRALCSRSWNTQGQGTLRRVR